MIFLTADLHLGHANIIRHCRRPFSSVEEMDKVIINNWNAAIGPKDEVYIIGDFTMRPAADAHEYLTRLNGHKYFIKGNHDRFLKNFESYASDFVWVKDYYVLRTDEYRIVLFHFPILEWDQFYRGAIHCFGHVHNSPLSGERLSLMSGPAFNVGVDVNEFYPVSLTDIIKRASQI